MGVPEDQQSPPMAVPQGDSAHMKTTHGTSPDYTPVSSITSVDKIGHNEKDGNFSTDVTGNEDGNEKEVDAEDQEEDTSTHVHGIKLITLIIALDLAVFLVALDQTIIATAIPKITDRFNSINDIGWYGSAYFLTSTALQPTFGRIYKFFHIKWVFLSAIGVFELGSLICAVAPSSTALIVGRAIAGIGVGGIFSGALIIIARSRKCLPDAGYRQSEMLTTLLQFR